MKHKIYNRFAALAFLILLAPAVFAQVSPKLAEKPVPVAGPQGFLANPKIDFNFTDLEGKLMALKFNESFKKLEKLNAVVADKVRAHVHENFVADPGRDADNYDQPGSGNQDYNQAAEKTRTISKTYSVDSKDKLAINNQYGKVSINVWAKNEIKVDVEIKAYEASESKAQDLLDAVNISESRQSDLISFKTNFERSNMNWWSRTRNGREERRGIQVNYVVYMPSRNPLDVTNRYGSTILPDFDGPVNINSSYGSLVAQKLDNAANRVKVSYGSASIANFSSGNLNVSYGSLKLDNADKLNADISYGSAKIGRLTNSGTLDVTYTGGFKIAEVDRNVKNLVINAAYSNIALGLDEGANFDFDVTVSYSGFSYDDDKVNITSKTPDDNAKGWSPTKNYKGHYNKSSDSRILIKSNYGGVKFL